MYVVRRLAVVGCLLFFTLHGIGCSKSAKEKPTYPVKGSVLYKGEPPVGAKVSFFPVDDTEGAVAWGTVGEDGQFRLTTKLNNDGAQRGEYDVTVSWDLPTDPRSDDAPWTGEMLPKKYQNKKTSKLQAEILPKSNVLEPFELN